MTDEYYEANRRNWNERAAIHAGSTAYNIDAFRSDPNHLSGVVAFDRSYLGDLSGLSAAHLQCHIGTDTLSLARLGADVTGLDQSENSIDAARQLFADTGTDGRFEIANVYDAPAVLGQRYDLVYTGVGALNWLPSIERWAQVVSELLKPGGRLYLREGHPMLQSLADSTDGSLRIQYPYFETTQPMVFDEGGTYTGDDVSLRNTRTYEWNHGLGEVVMSLLRRGLVLETLDEHDGLEWQMFPHMVFEDGFYKLPPEQRALVPMMYTLMVRRPAGG
jgi:SAM-dependent methyltransferase